MDFCLHLSYLLSFQVIHLAIFQIRQLLLHSYYLLLKTQDCSEGLFLKYFEPQTFIKSQFNIANFIEKSLFLLLFDFLNPINIFLASEVLYEALFGIYVFYKSKSKIKFSDSDVNQNIERQGFALAG